MSTYERTLPELSQRASPAASPAVEDLESLEAGGIRIGETVRIALDTLLANPLRTVLTALGVIIGVASVVALLAIGSGTQETIADRITANGANLLTVRASSATGGGNATLTEDDAVALADPANVPAAAAVSPESSRVAPLVAGSVNKTTIVLGVTPVYLSMHNNKLASGSFIDATQANSNVVVLGSKTATDLFPDGDPVGEQVRIRGLSFQVVGVLESKGATATGFDDDSALVPLQVAQKKLFGGRVASSGGKPAVASIVVQATDKDSIPALTTQLQTELRTLHNLPSFGGADDFRIDNQQDLINTLTETSRTMTLYLGAIAAISLIVGGIGIMNIMLVSVRERTREIGLRKSIGARERDILTQFIIEALALSTTGGLIGLVIGGTIAFVVNATGASRAIVSVQSVLLAVGFAMAVGLFFGIEPARRAAKLDPIEALRYE
ncbi:MAG: ABC transporter permease [Chloroflexota bacterium]|nr:ABC transporter permease [Chloroflexota bacterium]